MCYNNCGLVERQHIEFALRVLSLSSESNLGGNSYSNRISLIFHRACNFIFAYNQTWRPSCFLFFCSTRVKQRREKNKQTKCCKYDSESIFMICKSQCSFSPQSSTKKERDLRETLYAYEQLFSRVHVWHIESCVVWLLHNRQPLIQLPNKKLWKEEEGQKLKQLSWIPFLLYILKY